MIDIYWWSKIKESKDQAENFGDFLVPYLLDRTTAKKYQWVMPNEEKSFLLFKKKHYIIIGSILRRATKHSIVWGAGIMFSDAKVDKAKFLAVRGPRTRKRLLELGHKVPKKYGDPALLIAFFNQKKVKKKHYLGLVPHFLDYEEVKEIYKNVQGVRVVNLLNNDVQSVIDEINDCRYIISSSLHGVIVAHALKIPALWIKFSDKLVGDDVKFYDYYESVGIDYALPINFKRFRKDEIEKIFETYSEMALPREEEVNLRILDLVETFPFKKSEEFSKLTKNFLNR